VVSTHVSATCKREVVHCRPKRCAIAAHTHHSHLPPRLLQTRTASGQACVRSLAHGLSHAQPTSQVAVRVVGSHVSV
jgi:hypothetical protein